MITVDPYYGAFNIPEHLKPIVLSPEVQRLRDVRLINAPSIAFSSLNDVSRFSHTLGVLRLFLRKRSWTEGVYGKKAADTLEVALLSHDIGTPAFAHSYEKVLLAKFGWHHHEQVESILYGTYRPENKDHQLYYGNQLRLHDAMSDIDVDPRDVISIIKGDLPLGLLVNGSIDLDNIDNVLRMHNMLHLGDLTDSALALANSIEILNGMVSFRSDTMSDIQKWQSARARCYEVLSFDHDLLSSQAMLRECFEIAVREEHLGTEHWHLTDDQMLQTLFGVEETRPIVKRLAINDLYQVLLLQIFQHGEDLCGTLRDPVSRRNLEESIESETGIKSIRLFHLEDRGMFSKSLDFAKRYPNGEIVSEHFGTESRSIVLCVLTKSTAKIVPGIISRKARSVLEARGFVGLDSHIPQKEDFYALGGQKTLQV